MISRQDQSPLTRISPGGTAKGGAVDPRDAATAEVIGPDTLRFLRSGETGDSGPGEKDFPEANETVGPPSFQSTARHQLSVGAIDGPAKGRKDHFRAGRARRNS